MDEQILKDFVATAEKYNYDWNAVFNLFPELKSYDQQLLKDYTATAKKYNYDWSKANSYFPEFGFGQQQPTQQPEQQLVVQPTVKKKDDMESDWLFGDGSSESEPSKTEPETDVFSRAQKVLGIKQPQQEQVEPKKELDLAYVMGTDVAQKQLQEKMTPQREEYLTKPLQKIEQKSQFEEKMGKIEEATPEYLRPSIKTIEQSVEKSLENFVGDMNYQFGDAGFEFKDLRNGYFEIKAPDGTSETIRYHHGAEPAKDVVVASVNYFVKTKSAPLKGIERIEKLYKDENKKFATKYQVESELSSLSKEQERTAKEASDFLKRKQDAEAALKAINELPFEKRTANYRDDKFQAEQIVKRIYEEGAELQKKIDAIPEKQKNLEIAVGRYNSKQEKQGTWVGGIYNSMLSFVDNTIAGFTDIATDYVANFNPLSGYMTAEQKDKLAKDIKYGTEDELTFMEASRDAFRTAFGDKNTTEQWEALTKQSFIGGAVLGAAEFVPSMLIPGAWFRRAAMYASVNDMVNQEFENNPELQNISENEKLFVKVPIGIVGAVLEEYGVKNIVQNTALVKSITGRAILKATEGMAPAAFKKVVSNEISEMIADGTLRILGGGIMEFETGAAQQGVDIGVKSIFNAAKGKKLFDTPDTVIEIGADMALAGAQEMIGSVAVTTPMVVAAAYRKKDIAGIPSEYFNVFVESANDKNAEKAFIATLKNNIISGDMTNKEAVELLNNYRNSVGLLQSIPPELNNIEKKQAMNLLRERKELEEKTQGKDPALVKPIQDRITQINEQLSKLTEDAIQKQAASQVSLQPEAGTGQEVEVGGPEAKPKITPEESKRKEDLVAALKATDKDVIAIGDELLDRKEAQAELEAITQKEQAPVTEQGGMEQAEGLGTQLETVAKEEQTPAKMTTTEVLTSTPTETKAGVTFVAPDGNEVALEGNEQVAAQLYDEAVAVAEEQRTPEQNDIIQKMQPIVAAAPAAEVTPAEQQFTEQDRARKAELEEAMRKADKRRKNITVGETIMPKAEAKAELDALNQKEQAAQQPAAAEVTPAEVTPAEVTPAEVVERTAEQEADLLEELLTGKKKEPVAEEVVAEEKVEGKKLSNMIRGLEIKGPGGLQSNLLGIPIAIWNSAVKTTAAAIDANVAVAKAIQQGVKEIKDWIKKNNPSLSLNDAKIKNTILVETYAGVIKTARENNIKNEGLTAYFKRKGLSDAQIAVLFKAEQKEATELSEKTIPGYTKLMNRINGIIERGRRNGKTDDDIMKGVIANVESRSPEYANATDQQREQIIRDIRKLFGKKEKAAPSAEKITGKPKPKKVTVNEMTALKDQIRLEARAAREAKGDLNAKRKMLAAAINELAKKGKISVRQAKALINRVNAVNLDNPVMVERLLDYAEKVFNDAAYAEKLSQANELQSDIKDLSKNKKKFGNLTAFAAEFAKIDPALVENIDEYIEMASNVKEGVQGSKVVGEKVIPADMVDVGKTMEYVNKTMEAQEETIRLKTAERLQELMGVDVSDLTYDQMMELLDTPTDKKVDKYKKGIIRGFIDRMFNTYSTIIKDMFDTGIDPFSDPENPTTVEFKDSDKKIVEEFMAMDLSLLDEKEALRAADALNNFLTNKSTAGMVATLGDYNGRKNIKEVADKNIKAEQIKMYWSPILGRTFFQQIASIPAFFERLFKSYKTGRYIREMMGINSLINHKADAVTAANRVINNYIIEFSKKKPNNKNFQDISNIIERGIIGDLAKTIVGDAKQVEAEFNRRKKLIEQSIKILEKAGTKKELELAKTMKEVYDKIAKDSKTIEEVKAKADQINVDAVQFWVDQWAKLYDQFADVALNVYNRVLDKNVNYVPDRFGFLERAEKKKKDADGFESMFIANSNSEYFYKKEAGSLMKSTPPQSLLDEDGNSMDMYVNLSFDTNNANALMEALIDIKTAADIRQIQAFKNDSKFDDVFPFGKDAAAVKERIAALIRNIRNKRAITDKSFKEMVRKMDRIAAIGTSLLLAGPTQAISQTIPVAINTIINSKGKLNLSVLNNKDANRFIDESGMGIANRGSDAVTELETLNQKLEVASKTKAGAVVQYIENLNRKYLKLYLSNFDVFVARASWLTYYEKGLRKQGIKGKIDYSTHKQNKEAAQYAQDMLDRQQNISDKDLAGQLYQSDNPVKQFIVKVVMPLATFRMNQTTRFSNDLAILTSKTASTEERKEAAVSIGGFAAEMATFRAIKLYIGYSVFYSLAQMIRGEEDDEEEKQKTWDNMKRGAATSVVSDVFSPIPMTDVPTKILFAGVLDQLQNIAGIGEDDKFNIFTESKSSFTSDWGLLGVGVDKMIKLGEKVELARTGKFKDDFGNEKTISESDRALLSNPLYIGINVATVLGLNPLAPETDNVMNRITKMAKKNAMSNEQLKEAEELGVEGKKDLMKVKAEKKADKEEAYGGYETLKEFEEKEPEKFDEYSAPGGKLDKYREQERKEDEEKNKDQPFRGLSEEKFKELYPKEWAKSYGPGTAYFRKQNSPAMLQKKAQEKMREAQREQKRKMAEAKRKQQEAIRKASGK